MLGRWLQVDPAAGDAFSHTPCNSMFNNPISMSDPNGDFTVVALLINAAVAVIGNGIGNSLTNKPFFEGWGGAAIGGLMSSNPGQAFLGGLSSHLPSINIPIGSNFALTLSPSLSFGGGGWNIGLNIGISGNVGGAAFHFGVGVGYGVDGFTGNKGWNNRVTGAIGYSGEKFSVMLSSSAFNAPGIRTQSIGGFSIVSGDFSFSYENDGKPFAKKGQSGYGDGGDGFKSAALRLGIGDYEVGTYIFTGERIFADDIKTASPGYPYGTVGEEQMLMIICHRHCMLAIKDLGQVLMIFI